jgi:hypothetical protein
VCRCRPSACRCCAPGSCANTGNTTPFGAESCLFVRRARTLRKEYWGIWDRSSGQFRQGAHLYTRHVRLEPYRVYVRDGDVEIDVTVEDCAGFEIYRPADQAYIWSRKEYAESALSSHFAMVVARGWGGGLRGLYRHLGCSIEQLHELSGHVSPRAHSPNVRNRISLACSRPGKAGDSSRPKPASLASGSRSSNSSSESTEIFSGASSSPKS